MRMARPNLASLLSAAAHALDRLAPASVGRASEARQSRLLLGMVLLIGTSIPAAGFLVPEDQVGLRALSFGTFLVIPLALFVLRRTGSVFWTGQIYAASSLTIVLLAIGYRGFDSSAIAFLMLPTIVMTVVTTPRSGSLWGVATVVLAGTLAYLQVSGILPHGAPADAAEIVAPIVVGGFYTMYVVAFSESSARRAIAKVVALNDDLTQARDDARNVANARIQFLATMSHELRTPLNGVVGVVQLVRDVPMATELRDHMGTLEASARALLAIVNDILDLTKIESGCLHIARRPTHLPEILEGAVRLARLQLGNKPVSLAWRIHDGVARDVETDPIRLGQILVNLLSNAVKFTERGTIEIEVTTQSERLRIDVRDTGAGIPAESIGRIFEPFRQADESHERRYGGTGLGLPISRRVAQMLGGDLVCTSVVGEGSTFTATLGYTPCVAMKAPEARPQRSTDFSSLRVLIVDDHPINRKIAEAMLRKLGVTTDVAVDGLDAVQKWSADPHFDLVLMDWEMPELNGGDATARIRRLPGGTQVPIVALTAHVVDDFRKRCLDAGLDDYLSKPLVQEELIETLEACLAGRSGVMHLARTS